MFFYLVVSLVFSGYDAIATMEHIGRGVALEGNPLMAPLIQQHALVFFVVKMAMTVACLAVCYSFSHLRTGRLGLRLAAVVYSLVSIYHVLITFLG
jgi:hypothetical protein